MIPPVIALRDVKREKKGGGIGGGGGGVRCMFCFLRFVLKGW